MFLSGQMGSLYLFYNNTDKLRQLNKMTFYGLEYRGSIPDNGSYWLKRADGETSSLCVHFFYEQKPPKTLFQFLMAVTIAIIEEHSPLGCDSI